VTCTVVAQAGLNDNITITHRGEKLHSLKKTNKLKCEHKRGNYIARFTAGRKKKSKEDGRKYQLDNSYFKNHLILNTKHRLSFMLNLYGNTAADQILFLSNQKSQLTLW